MKGRGQTKRPLVTFGLVLTLAWQWGGRIAAQAPRDQHEVHRLHGNPAAYIATLENPARDAYQKPHDVIQALALRPGDVVVDIGAGSGYFALRLAHHVGPEGHVYAVDISPDMIRHLNARVRDVKLLNVSTILAQPNDPLLPQPVDRFLFVAVWHHVDDQAGYLVLPGSSQRSVQRWPAYMANKSSIVSD